MSLSSAIHIVRRALSLRPTESMRRLLSYAILTTPLVYGDRERLHVAPSAVINNALFNLVSGHIFVHENVVFGHGVSLLTGTHHTQAFDGERAGAVPDEGRDIVIEKGAWLASHVTVAGPCNVGRNAVVAAGSVVIHDVAEYTLVAGVPARHVRSLRPEPSDDTP